MNPILVIEDDTALAETLVDACHLADLNAEQISARNAIERLKNDTKINGIVLDLAMPDMDGIDFIRNLPPAAQSAQIPLFIMSGMDPSIVKNAGKLASNFGVKVVKELHKPLNIRNLVCELRELSGQTTKLDISAVEKAFEAEEFVQWYQPFIDLETGQCCGVEALVRWPQPDGKFIPPDTFIPILEKSCLVERFALWTIETAAKQWVQWYNQGQAVPIAVNLSANSLDIANMADRCAEIAKWHGMPMSQLIVEITETATYSHPPLAQDCLAGLRRAEARLAVDDFGTGYSSLKQLMALPYSEVKIDRCFTASLNEDKSAEAIVRAVVGLSHALGHTVIAEGVETQEVHNVVCVLGVDIAQGYFYEKPLPPDQVFQFFEASCRV